MYEPLREPASRLGSGREGWPSLDDYNRLLQSATVPVLTHSAMPLPRQMDELDTMMASHFLVTDSLRATAALTPLPLLGIPGWWPDNAREEFYENTRYFRPRNGEKQ